MEKIEIYDSRIDYKINELINFANEHQKEHKDCQVSLCYECGKKHNINCNPISGTMIWKGAINANSDVVSSAVVAEEIGKEYYEDGNTFSVNTIATNILNNYKIERKR